MRGGEQKQGYTIVEVMIFLVISGFMFIIAASFISGRQAKNEFRQGMNDINSQIRQTIGDVSNGFYPSNGGFKCSAGVSGIPTFSAGTLTQGTNQGCTFIGEVMHFNINGSPASAYNVYTVVGRQFKPVAAASATLSPPGSFAEALPNPAVGGGSQNLTQKKNLQWGIRLDQMTDNGANIGAFGIFAGFATTDSNNNLDSGAAAPIAIAIPTTTLGMTQTQVVNRIKALASSPSINFNPNIVMCFSGDSKQYGRLTLGTSSGVQGQKLATDFQISSGNPTGGCPP